MKNSLLYSIMVVLLLTSKAYCQNLEEGFLYVKFKPTASGAAFFSAEASWLNEAYGMVDHREAFKGAKSPILQNLWEVHLNGPTSELQSELLIKTSIDTVYIIPYDSILSCSQPHTINDTWLVNNWGDDVPLANANAYCAWSVTQGSPNVKIAIVDTEFDLSHEDLSNQIESVWGSPTSSQNHGTITAGFAAAETNNNKGTAAIGYKSKMRGYYASGWSLGQAVWQAHLDGADIINVSWSGIGMGWGQQAIAAVEEIVASGQVLVVAAGNSPGANHHSAYANIPGVINVSGVGPNNNHGTTNHARNSRVDVCAQSIHLFGAYPGNTYAGGMSGTSFAAPQVAGLAALIRSINPCLTPTAIEHIIKATASPINDAHLFPGLIGTGRIDAYQAVLMAQQYGAQPPISGNLTWFTERFVDGDLIIEPGASLTVTGKVYFSAGSRLIVKQGGKLIVDGGTLTSSPSCKTFFWSGIEAWGNSAQHQFPFAGGPYQAHVILKNGATIKNADFGVRLWRPGDWSAIGGIVEATNANFINCRKGLEFVSYQNFNPSTGNEYRNLSRILGCNFRIQDDYPDLNKNIMGQITMLDVHGLNIAQNHFVNEINTQIINRTRWGHGIYSINASYIAQKNTFKNLWAGITLADLTNISKVQVVDNTFEGCPFGSVVRNHDFAILRENRFNGNLSSGSFFHQSIGFLLTDNEYEQHIDQGISVARAISFNQLGSYGNEVYRNIFEENEVGINAQGSLAFGNQGLRFKCNDFRANHHVADISVSTGQIAVNQGNCSGGASGPAGNLFSQTCTGFQTDFNLHSAYTGFVQYRMHSPASEARVAPSCYTNNKIILSNCGTSFSDQSCLPVISTQSGSVAIYQDRRAGKRNALFMRESVLKTAINDVAQLIDDGNTQALLDLIMDNGNASSDIRDAVVNIAPYASEEVLIATIQRSTPLDAADLFDVLSTHSPLTQEVLAEQDIYSSILSAEQLLELEDVQEGYPVLYTLQDMLEEYRIDRDLALNELMRLFLHDTNDRSPLDTLAYYLEMGSSIETQLPLLRIYWEMQDWAKAATMLNKIADSPGYADVHEVLHYVHTALSNGENPFEMYESNDAFRAIVDQLADDCTKPGCEIARSFITLETDAVFTYWLDPINTGDIGKKAPSPMEQERGASTYASPVRLFPNPAGRNVTLVGEVSWPLTYEIFSINGSPVKAGILVDEEANTINTEQLKSGLYIIRVKYGNQTYTEKLIIN